ncbi:MAG: hypothetical protein ABFC62_03830 [Clostridiaceae bacterium]|nr:hypothetical protein [Eubacteriales bacterium]
MKKRVWIAGVLALAFMLSGCGALEAAGKLEQYDMSGDAIPSVTSVAGEREVTGVNAATNNGVVTKTYTYVSSTVYDDLWAYVQKLMDDGWLVTEDIDLNVVPGSGQLGMNSTEAGKILLVSFTYDSAGYVIELTKAKGTIG